MFYVALTIFVASVLVPITRLPPTAAGWKMLGILIILIFGLIVLAFGIALCIAGVPFFLVYILYIVCRAKCFFQEKYTPDISSTKKDYKPFYFNGDYWKDSEKFEINWYTWLLDISSLKPVWIYIIERALTTAQKIGEEVYYRLAPQAYRPVETNNKQPTVVLNSMSKNKKFNV